MSKERTLIAGIKVVFWNALVGFVVGVALGSFGKALADRSLTSESFWGRSKCVSCKHKLHIFDLVPIFSYICLRGRCRYCGDKITVDYFLAEVFFGLIVAFLAAVKLPPGFLVTPLFQNSLVLADFAFQSFVILILGVVFLTDLKTGLIPDRVSFPSMKIALSYLALLTIAKIALLYVSLTNSQIGKYLIPPYSDYFYRHSVIQAMPFLTALLMAVVLGAFFGFLIFITKGRGMGGGDLKLGIFMGLGLGFPNAITATVLAFLLGSVAGIALIIFGKKHFGETIPFGPFLSLGGVISIFYGQQILDWYTKLFYGGSLFFNGSLF